MENAAETGSILCLTLDFSRKYGYYIDRKII
jgi:hypothetical protein